MHNDKEEDLINNKYKKIQKLGEGGYGRVSKCGLIQEETESHKNIKFYAIKKFFLQKVIKG